MATTEEKKTTADQTATQETQAVKTNPNATTQAQMQKTKTSSSQLQKQFNARQKEARSDIKDTFNDATEAQKAGLKDAWKANKATIHQERVDTSRDYTSVDRNVRAQINQNGAALNQFADVRGINRNAGSQQALQLNQVRSTARGQIQAQRMRALEENARQSALAKTDYQNRVRQAIKDRNYTRAAALLDDYNNQNTWRENQAKILAGYGNFDAYGQMYGDQQAQNMRDMWIATNPEMAYNTGVISAERYKEITGRDAPGVEPVGGSTGYSRGLGDMWWHLPEANGYAGTGNAGNTGNAGAANSSSDNSAHWATLADRGLA